MSAFEYVTVLIAIVLSLGIAQILTGVASLIKKSHKVVFYWPHLLWVLFILLLHIQEWWIMYELKAHQPWRLPFFLFIMIYPVNLFLLARLLFPDKYVGKVIDMKQYYFKNFRKLFLLLAMSALVCVLYNLFVLNMSIADQLLQLLLMLSVMFVAIRNLTVEWIHKVLSLVIITTMILSIAIEWNIWLIE
jgi:hypothetical protein